MDLPAALAAELAALSAAEPGTDLEEHLRALAADLARAVNGYRGLAMTVLVDGRPVTLHAAEPDGTAAVVASLLLPLSAEVTLVLYAARAGAFVDLAADLAFGLGLPLAAVVLDAHLSPPAGPPALSGLRELATVNQAIGVLIGRGHTQAAARDELTRLAAAAGRSVLAGAEHLLRGLRAAPGSD